MLSKTCTICKITFYALKKDDFKKHFHKAKLGKYGFAARCEKCRYEKEVLPRHAELKAYWRSRWKKIPQQTKKCRICLKEFTPRDSRQVLCGDKECFKKNKFFVQKIRRRQKIKT